MNSDQRYKIGDIVKLKEGFIEDRYDPDGIGISKMDMRKMVGLKLTIVICGDSRKNVYKVKGSALWYSQFWLEPWVDKEFLELGDFLI